MNANNDLTERCIKWCRRELASKQLAPNHNQLSYYERVAAWKAAEEKIPLEWVQSAINAMSNIELIALIGAVLAEEK